MLVDGGVIPVLVNFFLNQFIFAASLGAPCPMPDPSSYCLNGGTCLYFEPVQEQACK